jgi:hypothetical protein
MNQNHIHIPFLCDVKGRARACAYMADSYSSLSQTRFPELPTMPASIGPMVLESRMNLLPPAGPDEAHAHNNKTHPTQSHVLIGNLFVIINLLSSIR